MYMPVVERSAPLMQTRLQSVLEVTVNYIMGYLLAWVTMQYLLNWLGYHVQKKESSGIVMVFTVISVIRSYVIRRLFNWIHSRR